MGSDRFIGRTFLETRSGLRTFRLRPVPEKPLYVSTALFKDPRSWSPDGKFIAFDQLDPLTNRDLWILPVEGDHTPKPYVRTPFNEQFPQISPDGRWMAYVFDWVGALKKR